MPELARLTRDLSAHNAESAKIWAAYKAGRPLRVPVTFSVNPRVLLLDPSLNPRRYTCRQYCEDPDVMWDVILAFHKWMRFEVPQDAEMGAPQAWPMGVYFFNTYEAGWFGCPLHYPENDIPDTRPMFQKDKERLYDTPLPDPLKGNLMGRAFEFYEAFQAKRRNTLFEGRPVESPWLPTGTDGPLTVACNLRGTTELCEDLIEDEPYFHALMEFVTQGILARCEAWSRLGGLKKAQPGETEFFADDSIALLSPQQYRRYVLPYHKRLMAAWRGQGKLTMHLCGRASHLFKVLVQELGVDSFETGFPVDLGVVRKDLGPGTELTGNLHPGLLHDGPVGDIDAAVKKICGSGVMQGGRFILSDGSDCAPGTPRRHFEAAYQAARHYGVYPRV